MKSAEDWLIYIESTETVEWTKWLRDAKEVIEKIQRDALEAAATKAKDKRFVDANNSWNKTYNTAVDDISAAIRAMKPEASK